MTSGVVSLADAAELGAVVDELVISIHRASSARHGHLLRPRFAALRLASPGHVVDLAEFLLAGACTVEVVRLRFRYDVRAAIGGFDDLVRLGLIDSDSQSRTDLADLLANVLGWRADAAAAAWPGDLTGVLADTRRAVAAAQGSLADRHRHLTVPDRPAGALHHLLTTLRYGRMDAHAAAWAAHDLESVDIVTLDAVVDDGPVDTAARARLIDRGWLDHDGAVSDAGRRARESIEAETNARCRHLLEAVDRPAEWLASLKSLAG